MNKELLIPPTVIVGSLIPYKGKWWKCQLYDQAGGMITFDGETTGQTKAVSQNPILVLELQGDTTGELKRRKGADKRGALFTPKGFRARRLK